MKRFVWLGLFVGLVYSLWVLFAGQTVPASVALSAAPAQGGTVVRFAAIGDFGSNSNNALAVSNLVKSWNPNLVITVGDNNYPDGAASTIDKNIGKYYRQFIYPYIGTFGPGATENNFYPALGNHDWASLQITNNTVTGPYFDYFVLPSNERYYDFVEGPVHFFVVDSDPREPDGVNSTSVQANWIRDRMAQSTAPWQVVYMHHAPYSSGLHGSTTTLRWPFKNWGADMVIAGHDHTYERLNVDGIPYLVNGFGGVALYNFRTILPESQVRYNAKHGAVLVDASTVTMTIRAYNVDGLLLDQYALDASGNQAPSVAITAPPNGATLAADTPTVITAIASDVDGSVSQVLFQANGTPIAGCLDTSAPYECTWTPATGNHSLNAIATDNLNLATVSAPINVTAGTGSVCPSAPLLVINEIMYNPLSTLNSDDWVEIHNPTGSPVSLANWVLQDSTMDFIFGSNATIPANGYIVAVKDYVFFKNVYPSVTNIASPMPFRFSNTGEAVRLLTPTRCLLDEVIYSASTPWPTTPNAGGPSLSLLTPNLDNALASSWAASSNQGGTPAVANGLAANQPPTVSIITPVNGVTIPLGSLVTITAIVSDVDGIVTQVVLRDNGSVIAGCTITTAPDTCTYAPTVGSHALTAVATDDDGASMTSPTVNITVSGTGGNAPFLEQGGLVVMEAENYHAKFDRSNHSWQATLVKPGYGGAGAMFASPNNGANLYNSVAISSPEMQYSVQFSTTGTYYVWLRTWADDIKDNSVWDGINGVVKDEFYTAYGDNLWTWSFQTFSVLTPGIHTISIWMREDGLYLDRFLMARSGAYTPTGVGPAESPRAPTLLAAAALDVPIEPAAENVELAHEQAARPAAAFTVALVAPVGGEQVNADSRVTLMATLQGADPANGVNAEQAEILFYANGEVIATCDATSVPHECTWQATPGLYTLTAVAFVDNERIESAPVTIPVSDESAVLEPRSFLPLVNR